MSFTKPISEIADNLIPSYIYPYTTSVDDVINTYTGVDTQLPNPFEDSKVHMQIYYFAYKAHQMTEQGKQMAAWQFTWNPHAADSDNYPHKNLSQKLLTALHKYYIDPETAAETPQSRAFNLAKGLNIIQTRHSLEYHK